MSTNNPAQRRYAWRFLSAMLTYAAILLLAQHAIRQWHPIGVAMVALAAAPALPLVVAVAVMGLYLAEERDEFIRASAVTAMLIATGLLLATASMWGFLEAEGMVPHVVAWAAFPIWATFLGVGQGVVALRHRIGGPA